MEDYILKHATENDLKVVVFTGPVFSNSDKPYREKFLIPKQFWKVVVIRKDDGRLSATAYIETQEDLINDMKIAVKGFEYGAFKTYQVTVTRIEELTHLKFGNLKDFDPSVTVMRGGVTAKVLMPKARLINGPDDIHL